MSRDYENRLHGFIRPSEDESLGRYSSAKIVNGKLKTVDRIYKIEDAAFDSFDLIVNNSNYSPGYLKEIYIVEFYKILQKIHKRITAKNGN